MKGIITVQAVTDGIDTDNDGVIDEVDVDDDLEIDQMIEPIVMSNEGVLRAGTVVLRKRSA
mgnify:CR=1 FL=1